MPRVRVIIKHGGKAEIKVEGMTGSGCAAATKAIEDALGRKVKDIKTPEYYKTATGTGLSQGAGG